MTAENNVGGIFEDAYELLQWDEPVIKSTEENEKPKVGPHVPSESDECDDYSFDIEEPNETDTQDIIKSIFPPRQWEENGITWIQYVSTEPRSRSGLEKLSEKLKEILRLSGAREKGICDIRRKIYSQLFDELTRHITAKNPERGLLLLRVRDDIKMTLEAYQRLANSAVKLGQEKAAEAEEGLPELLNDIKEFKIAKEEEKVGVLLLEKKFAAKERLFKDWKDREVAKHKRKIDFLKATNEGIQGQWDLITAWKPQNIEMEKYLFEEDN